MLQYSGDNHLLIKIGEILFEIAAIWLTGKASDWIF